MNVSLTPELEEFIQKKVDTGRYTTASEVIREALRLLEQHDQLAAIKLGELRKEIRKGLDSGRSTPLNVAETKRKVRGALLKKQRRRA